MEDLIVTLTINPAIDHNVTADRLVFEDRAYILSTSDAAGGRGINASCVVSSFGGKTLAIVTSGGPSGERFRKLLRERDIGIELAPAARSFLADKGFDPIYGARPLKRAITTYLQNPLARRLITGEFAPGETVWVTRAGDELGFSLKPTAASSAVS